MQNTYWEGLNPQPRSSWFILKPQPIGLMSSGCLLPSGFPHETASPSDCLVSYTWHSWGGGFTHQQTCSLCILQPQPTRLVSSGCLLPSGFPHETASPSDFLVSYIGHSWGGRVLPLSKAAVCVFYSPQPTRLVSSGCLLSSEFPHEIASPSECLMSYIGHSLAGGGFYP